MKEPRIRTKAAILVGFIALMAVAFLAQDTLLSAIDSVGSSAMGPRRWSTVKYTVKGMANEARDILDKIMINLPDIPGRR